MLTVRDATIADLPQVSWVLAAAFEDDPVWEWMVPPSPGWQGRLAAFFAKECRLHLVRGGEILVDDATRGVAVWSPPNCWQASPSDTARLASVAVPLFRSRLVRALRTEVAVESHHPREPHWYLNYLGTRPGFQGQGIGSSLVAAVTRRCDEQGLPAYLESSKEANLALYHRHGFEITGQFDTAGGGPPLWTMWRDPRPGGAV